MNVSRIFSTQRGPQLAALDDYSARRLAVGIELDRVARRVGNVAVADRHVAPTTRDAVRVVLVLERAREHVVDAATLDDHAPAEHADAVAAPVADLAVPHGHVVGGDFHEVSAGASAIHDEVLIYAGLGDFEAADGFRIGEGASPAVGADGPLRARERCGDEEQDQDFHFTLMGVACTCCSALLMLSPTRPAKITASPGICAGMSKTTVISPAPKAFTVLRSMRSFFVPFSVTWIGCSPTSWVIVPDLDHCAAAGSHGARMLKRDEIAIRLRRGISASV
jgi:hypothetical protein